MATAQAPVRAQLPTITNQPSNRTVWAGANVTLTVGASGTGPLAVRWLFKGAPLPDLITTVAGGGVNDGGAATNAVLGPSGTSVDAAGNLFIADTAYSLIRKVGTNGIISTVAGDGNVGYLGDGGTATSASLNNPTAVLVDQIGNLFIADTGNNAIREVAANGIISTIAGKGVPGYSGDGHAATNATLHTPQGLAMDASGNLFFADTYNNRIRRISTKGIITTFAGNGMDAYAGDGGAPYQASFSSPSGVALDAAGNLFIADTGNNRVRRVSANGYVTTFAGNGTSDYSGDGAVAYDAGLPGPVAVALDGIGDVFIAHGGVIRQVDTNRIITTFAGMNTNGFSGDGGAATNAVLNGIAGVSVDMVGNVFIADNADSRVREVNTNGIISTVAGNGMLTYSGDGVPGPNATLYSPAGVALDTAGNLFIADTVNNRIRKLDTNGIITTIAGNGANGYTGDGGKAGNASLNFPIGLALDTSGNLFIADGDTVVRELTTNGIITSIASTVGDGFIVGVAVDRSGNLFIAERDGSDRIREVNTSGIITTVAGNGMLGYSGDGGPATNASISYPSDVKVDRLGNLFVSDWDGAIRKVDTSGTITTYASGIPTNHSFTPWGLALDDAGDLFIADFIGGRIWEVNSNGIITTVAGGGFNIPLGDGGPALSAGLVNPQGVAVDASGNLFIADSYHNRIREVIRTEGPILTLKNVSSVSSGGYQAIVTGLGGSVTSLVATLTVVTSPLIYQAILNADRSLSLGIVSQPNSTNLLLTAANLSPPVVWQPLSTNVAGADGDWQYTDTSATSSRARYYRTVAR